jgi:hypothetical protein
VLMDTDGNRFSDMAIVVDNIIAMQASDFFL